MSDGRSNRKAKVVPFLGRIERERLENLRELIAKAQLMQIDGFQSTEWNESTWKVTGGRLVRETGKNTRSVSLNFAFSPNLGAGPLIGSWAEVAKSLLILRFHRYNQAATNQRNFITAIGYVAHASQELGLDLEQLTPEALDAACGLVDKHYKPTTAYNIHKHIAEFASHCDANGLCKVTFKYKYSKMKRPADTGGIGIKRLDDPTTLNTESNKVIEPLTFKVIGELYQNLPKDHKYRLYILVLTLLACTGRRFSEISQMPNQKLHKDDEGKSYLEYFPKKASQGDVFTPKRKLYLPTEVVPIVEQVIIEMNEITQPARSTAEEMDTNSEPNFRFLSDIKSEQKLFKKDLIKLGITPSAIDSNGWLRKQKLAWHTIDEKTKKPVYYTNKAAIKAYCAKDYEPRVLEPIHIDQQGKEYKLKDLLIIRPLGLSSGAYAHWLATHCSHAMFTTFLRYFPQLAQEFASSSLQVDFTSHHFRHTMNTLLDEGGLSDLLQTEWFGRSNPRDTKAYQHTSREKRALMLREDIKKGLVDGQLAKQIQVIPIEARDAVLKARVQAVHDVGTGICIHNFSQMPCERHLQCSADCKDYVWAKDDKGRLEEQKRQYALTVLAKESAQKMMAKKKRKKSADWFLHNEKKIKTLAKQLANNGVYDLDAEKYLREVEHG